ncbi:MAG: transcription antitermination factor NusB [Paludibacter sp.]|nr:transcription antitermination factor NusB [Paludibacter sp.]MDD4198798.1 transcription antitermination factor NusB [Paludibacter sp.]MDD4427502.1 transcription antitermination factor NusB [Paludibacter sp.]
MINRILLRIKIIQILYAFYKGEGKTALMVEKELFHSIEKTYDLYYHLFNLAVLITDYAVSRIESKKNKLRPSPEDINPNTRFIDNTFVAQLRENIQFNTYLNQHKLSWVNHPEIIKELYEEVVACDFYQEYMNQELVDYQEDKDLWRKIFKKVVLLNENLDSSIEDQSIFWTDDVEIVVSFIIKTIKRFDREAGAGQALLPMFKDEEDVEFAKKLLHGVINNGNSYREIIDKHTQNWELDRIAFMDILIMQVALSELMDFPTIPVNVTLNEYIEIAKNYSTDKSGTFINGVLDNIVGQLKQDNKLIKVVMFTK